MMALIEDPDTHGFNADIPDDVRDRARQLPSRQAPRPQRDLPEQKPELTYAPPSNCVLHFLSPGHEVRPSFATVIGLSLCPECTLHVAEEVASTKSTADKLITDALAGLWL